MIRLLGVLVALIAASPALAQDTPYAAAVEARLAGDARRAVALLQTVVAQDPKNSDAQVQLGLAQLALGALERAEHAFTAALAIAPEYADARIGLARVAQRRGEWSLALDALALIDPANPDAAILRTQLTQSQTAPQWELGMEASYSSLSRPQSDWQEAAMQLRKQAGTTTLAARIEYARRFAIDDVYLEGMIEQRISPGARGYVVVGATIDPDFRPQWQVGAGGSLRVRGGHNATVLTLDSRQARFASGDVQSLAVGVEQYIGGGAWLTGRWINLFDERGTRRSGYLVRGDVQVSDPVRLFAGYSEAPDTDEGQVVAVRSLFGGAAIDIGPATSLRISIGHEDRATGFDRTQFGLGFGLRF